MCVREDMLTQSLDEMFKAKTQNPIDDIGNSKRDAATGCMSHLGLKSVYAFHMCAKPSSILMTTVFSRYSGLS